MQTWIGKWNYANTGKILQLGRYREHYLCICGKASGIMPVLGEFFKLVSRLVQNSRTFQGLLKDIPTVFKD